MNDTEALQSFVATRSDQAFAKLVESHLDLVYAAALRQSRDRHVAEEITQAVFVILARKAASIRDPLHLPGRLIRTTRYAALNALKGETRRRRHESEAAAMAVDSYTADESEETAKTELMAALDEQLASLGEADRTAIALRFFQGLPLHEVGERMGSSADAAQKRITRAMQKLRGRFAREGIVASADAITAALIAENIHAPATLGAAIKTAATSPAVSAIAQQAITTMFWTPLRVAAVSAASIGVIAGGTILFVDRPSTVVDAAAIPASALPAIPVAQTASPSTTPGILVMKIPNVMMGTMNPVGAGFERGFDNEVKRAGEVAVTVFSTDPEPHRTGSVMFSHDVTKLRGKRIRVSAYLMTEKVEQYAGITVMTWGNGRVLAHDDMGGRGIRGTNDFTKCESVLDVHPDASNLVFGAVLHMKGKLWADSFQIEIVGDDVPTTDDQHWHKWSWRSCEWSSAIDENCRRNGRPTTRISSNPDAVRGGWAFYEYSIRDVQQYAGKRTRLTMWLKSENVEIRSGPHIFVKADSRQIADDGMRGNRPILGTQGWQQYEAFCDIPLEATSISPGITLNGRGTMWIDEVHFEVVGP